MGYKKTVRFWSVKFRIFHYFQIQISSFYTDQSTTYFSLRFYTPVEYNIICIHNFFRFFETRNMIFEFLKLNRYV